MRRVNRLGFLANVPPTTPDVARNHAGLFQGLRELGYIEGQNLVVERRYAEGRAGRWPELANELVGLKVDVIVVLTTPAALAVKKATSTIPIVMPTAIDPVGAGLAANPANELAWRDTEGAARALGLRLHSQPVRGPEDFEGAFAEITKERPDGLTILADTLVYQHRKQILDFATRKRLPGVFQFRDFAELGGLMSYGPNLPEMYRRAASYVDRILKGSKPGDLPIEQPTKYELVINFKTAKALRPHHPPIAPAPGR